ncbi:DsbA family protein [Sphingomonas soli]|uniref:DsbA family protein n=1 Tax=Sphingomonas soli TaxID=266127 RepID=UPI000832C0FD|nr:DsbA family protein [Sphingomonas soli]
MNEQSLLQRGIWLLLAQIPLVVLLAFLLMPGSPLPGHLVRNYLLDHPQILADVSDKLREANLAEAQKAQEEAQKALPASLDAVRKPYGSAQAGNLNGDVTVVAFMDYACGYCRASLPGIEELIAKDPNVRIVYRELPVLGPGSVVAARWALAAAEQGKYLAFHNALYAEGPPNAESITAAAAKAGLDKGVADKAVGSRAVNDEIDANHALAQKLAMTGTPAWVIGAKLYSGALDYEGLAEAVAEARKAR